MIIGADFSSLEETEAAGGRFFCEGREGKLPELLGEHGVTAVRLKLWNDPFGPRGEPYLGGTNDLDSVIRIAKRARDCGMGLLLDFHYSDFWADPGRQMIPKAWRGVDLDTMAVALYRFTADSLDRLDREGLSPEAVQVGNEITNGMLWPVGRLSEGMPRQGYDALSGLLRAGVRAVREHSGAKVVLHLERSGDHTAWRDWLDNVTERGVDFDVLGASYYPYWHGGMAALRDNLEQCIRRYHKDVVVVETAYPFTAEHYFQDPEDARLCIADPEHFWSGDSVEFPLTPEGQAEFLTALIRLVRELPEGRGKGVFWWEPGWLPAGGTAWASAAALDYCGEQGKPTANEWANNCLFDYEGNALPALFRLKNT